MPNALNTLVVVAILSLSIASILAFVPSSISQCLPSQTETITTRFAIDGRPKPTVFKSKIQRFASTSIGSSTEDQENAVTKAEIYLLDEVDSIFDCIDKNGDGEITLKELRIHLVDEMGYSEEYTQYLFASIDTDSSGSISREEMRFAFYNFEALSMYMTFGMGGADITQRKAFKELALKSASGANQYEDPEARDKLLLDDLADLIFDMIDTDGSGEISREELKSHFDGVTSRLLARENKESSVEGEAPSAAATDTQAREYVQTMFTTLDANRDGGICREEIRTAFEKYDFKLLARTFGLRVYQSA